MEARVAENLERYEDMAEVKCALRFCKLSLCKVVINRFNLLVLSLMKLFSL